MEFPPVPVTSSLLGPKSPHPLTPQQPILERLRPMLFPECERLSFTPIPDQNLRHKELLPITGQSLSEQMQSKPTPDMYAPRAG